MALINTLRNKMGKFIVAAVAIAIMSFVLADLLGPDSALLGGGNNVGEIAGHTVTLKEFQNSVQERESVFVLQGNGQPNDKVMPTLRQQAWDLLITEYAFSTQYDKVGIQVTDEEVWDMMQGKNIDPGLKQSFTNPETGQYERESFLNYLQQLPSLSPDQRVRWELFKSELVPGRSRIKYENLLTKTSYITTAESAREYHIQNDVAEVKYLYVPYYAISDSAVTVNESAIQTYYDENKERYKVENTRSLSYVSFDVIPSADDTLFVMEELKQLREEFKKVVDDSVFADLNTDAATFYGNYHIGTLPIQLKANYNNLSKGDIRGPYPSSEGFVLYKISDIFESETGYAKASHILIKGDDAEAKAKAEDILKQLKNGADFAAMAREHGTDGTKNRGGDLGWFESGKMVADFEKPVFEATKVGLLNNVVKTEFGYHIIKVDEIKTNTTFKIASIERNILPSDKTINEAFIKADLFASSVDDFNSFTAKAAEDSLNVIPVNKLNANDRRITTLGDARQVVQWLFNDASKGNVSDVFELDNTYVVAVMTGEIEEGYQPLKEVKEAITAQVKNEIKGDKIIEKLTGIAGSLDEKAQNFGEDANVYSTSDLVLSTNSLPSVGFDPTAVGKAFSLTAGQTSEPFAGENGVLIIQMENITIAPEIADYSMFRTQAEQRSTGRVGFGITEAIKENADIIDERYKFY